MTKQAAYHHLQQADALLHEANQDDPHVVWAHRLVHQAACHFSSLPEVREMAAIDSPIMLAAVPPRYYGEGGVLEVAPAAPTPPQDGQEGESEPDLNAGGSAWDAIYADHRLDRARSKLSLHEINLVIGHARRCPRPTPAAQPSAPAVQGEWLPIESAPRDGDFILACDANHYPDRMWVAWWVRNHGGKWVSDDMSNESILDLTHWRPLPAPPGTPSPVAGDAVAVTDEMVEAALDSRFSGENWRDRRPSLTALMRKDMRAALEAALRVSGSVAGGSGTMVGVLTSLEAAISLLERGGKKAAPSDRMFEQMLTDYRNSADRARAALRVSSKGER